MSIFHPIYYDKVYSFWITHERIRVEMQISSQYHYKDSQTSDHTLETAGLDHEWLVDREMKGENKPLMSVYQLVGIY